MFQAYLQIFSVEATYYHIDTDSPIILLRIFPLAKVCYLVTIIILFYYYIKYVLVNC